MPAGGIVRADTNFEDTARYMAYGLTGKDYFINLDDEAVPERQISMTYDDCAEVMPPNDLGSRPDFKAEEAQMMLDKAQDRPRRLFAALRSPPQSLDEAAQLGGAAINASPASVQSAICSSVDPPGL